MIKFATEGYANAAPEIRDLIGEHWEEIAMNRDVIPLKPDWVRYAAMDERGQLLICTAREPGGLLVGYAIYFLAPHGHLHYSATPWAESDIFYLVPEKRGVGTAALLMNYAEHCLRERGISVMHTRTKIAHPSAGALLEHLGHSPIETVYAKYLKD